MKMAVCVAADALLLLAVAYAVVPGMRDMLLDVSVDNRWCTAHLIEWFLEIGSLYISLSV
jgi:hypothetical protein